MAQPPESSQVRPQLSSLDLDSSFVELPSQPAPDAPAQREHHHQQRQQQQHKEPQKHLQNSPRRQQQPTGSASRPPQTRDAPADIHCTIAVPAGFAVRPSRCSGEETDTTDGGSTVSNVHPNNHASAELAQDARASPTQTRFPNGDAPLMTSTATMSNPQPPTGHPRHPMGYPAPTTYPPAVMPSTPHSHYAYPPQAMTAADAYRAAPTALPSMRTLEHGQPSQISPHSVMPLGTHMAGPLASTPTHMGFYSVPTHGYGLHPDPNTMRFTLAPGGLAHDPRIALSGGRHKKEIKRRTKTGCLTCRKRRIKCDEAHPTCNNCKKSKRECLGYDPIFKQQQGPAAIQPAPNSQPSTPATLASTPTPTLPSSTGNLYQATYPPPLPSNAAFDSPLSSAPQPVKSEPAFDYSTAIDPALQNTDASSASATSTPVPQYHTIKSDGGPDQNSGDKNHLNLRGGIPSSLSTLSALSQPPLRENMSAHTSFPAKKMKVDELVALGGRPPSVLSSPPSVELLDEITTLYNDVYAPGLAAFFETQWYKFAKNPAMAAQSTALLHHNQPLIALFTSFLHTISKITSTDPADMVSSGHLETAVVWALARLPQLAPGPDFAHRPVDGLPSDDDAREARGRLYVVETLISGETLASNPLTPPPTSCHDHLRNQELEFWYHLGQLLLQVHSRPFPPDNSYRENCLKVMRSLLHGRENRDVLYSIAVLREYTAHWDATLNEQTVSIHLDESDPRSKLAVATRFIRDESASTGGTTNVVRRFAELACRAFIRPGSNASLNRRMS